MNWRHCTAVSETTRRPTRIIYLQTGKPSKFRTTVCLLQITLTRRNWQCCWWLSCHGGPGLTEAKHTMPSQKQHNSRIKETETQLHCRENPAQAQFFVPKHSFHWRPLSSCTVDVICRQESNHVNAALHLSEVLTLLLQCSMTCFVNHLTQ